MTVDPALMVFAKGVSRAVVYASAIILVGCAVFQTVVLRRASRAVDVEAAGASCAALMSVAAASLFVGYATRFYVQVIESFLVLVPTGEMVGLLFFSTLSWGLGMLAQLLLSGTVFMLLAFDRRGGVRRRTWVALVGAALAVLSVPLTGHAIAHAGPLAVGVQTLHVAAVGGWLGTVSVLWWVGRRIQSPLALHAVVRAFSPVALSSALVVVAAGIAALFVHVETPRALLTTRYGLVLLTKVGVVAVAAGAGYRNWRHLTPRLLEPHQRDRFFRTIVFEVGCVIIAVVLTAVLTSLPRPGDE